MNELSPELAKLIPLLIPILIIQIGFQIAAIVDLVRRPAEEIKGQKWVWALIILIGEILGPIAYFLFARREA